MPTEATTLYQDVVIDGAQAVQEADRVSNAVDRMADSGDRGAAAMGRTAKGFDILNAAAAKVTPAQISAANSLNRLKAEIDPAEAALQKMARAEKVLERAVRQKILSEEEAVALGGKYRAHVESLIPGLNNAGRAGRGMGVAMQQAGYQIGDFAVQVSSGQGVLRPFIQQGTQLVSMFGPWGAVVGAAGAVVGALATSLLDAGDAADVAAKSFDNLEKTIDEVNKVTEEGIKSSQDFGMATLRQAEAANALARSEADAARQILNRLEAEKVYNDANTDSSSRASNVYRIRSLEIEASIANARENLNQALGQVDVTEGAIAELQKKIASAAASTVDGINAEIDVNERLASAMGVSRHEYEVTKKQLEILASDGFKGTEEAARALAERYVDSAEKLGALTEGSRKSGTELERQTKRVQDQIEKLNAQAEAQTAIAAAYEVSIAKGKQEELNQKARIATLGLGTKAAEEYAAALKNLAEQQAHAQAVAAHSLATTQLEVAAWKARAAQISDPTLKHEEELRIERQEKLNQLMANAAMSAKDVAIAMRDFDAQQALDDQTRFWNDVSSEARKYGDDIRTYLLDGITNATDGGKDAFDDLWETAEAGLKRFLVNAALTAAENAIVVPILTDVVGSNSGLFGIVAPSGGAGGAGAAANAATGGGGIGDLFSLGNGGILSGFDSLLSYNSTLGNSFVTGSVGQWLGLSTPAASGIGPVSVSGAGQALAGLGNILGSGGIGYGVGSLYGALGLGNSTGSSIGGALGGAIGSIIPGIGTIIGSIAGSVIGGFFGNDQPSDMFAQTSFDLRAGEVSGTYYNPAEFSQANLDASGNLIDSFSQIAMQIEALTGGVLPESAFAKVGSRDGIVVGVGEAGIGVNTPQFGDTASFANSKSGAEKALNFMVEALAKQITDIADADYKRILEMGGSGEDILANLDVAAQIKALGQTESVNQAEEQLQTLVDTFEELRAKAIELQLAVEDVNDAEAQQLRNLEQGVRTNFAATVHGYIDQFLTPLQALQETISTSGQSTYEKFQAAQSLFRDVAAKAADGNEVALGLLDEAGKNYADLARNLTGTTAPLRNFLESLNSGSLSNLTPREQLAAAQGSFDELSARALAGDSSVMGDLAQAAQDYLTIARDYGASGSVYQQAYEQVTGSLNQIVDVVDGAIGSVDPTSVLDEINTAISPLIDRLVASEAEILAGIEPSLDDLNGNFLLNIETLKDEGDQTRELLADIATALGAVPGQATGGLVTGMGGPTSDSNLRRLSAGEYVNTASAVTRFGVGFFDALNSGYVPAVSMPSNDNSGTTAAIGQLSDISTQGFNGLARVFREELADLRRSVDELAKETSRNRQYASIQAKR